MNTTPTLVATSSSLNSSNGTRPSFVEGEELLMKGMVFYVRQTSDNGIVAEIQLPDDLNPHIEKSVAAKYLIRTRFHDALRVQLKGYWFSVAPKGINGPYLTLLYFGRSSHRPGDRSPSSRTLKRARRNRRG